MGAPSGDDEERTRVGGLSPFSSPPNATLLSGGPAHGYRSGEIEPNNAPQVPAPAADNDWEEKTVVDDGQLYGPKKKPRTLSPSNPPDLGSTTDDDHTFAEVQKSPSSPPGLSPRTITFQPAGAKQSPGRPGGGPQPGAASARPDGDAPVPEAVRGKLVVVAGNDSGREFPLTGKPITVGRGIDNDVVLTDIAVSRKHLMLSFVGDHYKLTDKGSGNGTIINQRVETGSCPLTHGDRIEIGNTVFRFEHPASESADSASAANWSDGADSAAGGDWASGPGNNDNNDNSDNGTRGTSGDGLDTPPPPLMQRVAATAPPLAAPVSTPHQHAIDPVPSADANAPQPPAASADSPSPAEAAKPSATPLPVVTYPPGVRPLSLASPPSFKTTLLGVVATAIALLAFSAGGLILADDMAAPPPQMSISDLASMVELDPAAIVADLLSQP